MNFRDRAQLTRPKRMLAIDGGGIRGTLSLEFLLSIEQMLQRELDADRDFVLADYFDYIAGTSSGAIIAAGLATGLKVDAIRELYVRRGAEMFAPASLTKRFHYRYDTNRLKAVLQAVFGADTTFGDEQRMKTLLMMVMRNASTDSPWPLSNNPASRYNHPSRPDNNLLLPLWQLVRASTAAPTYFPPELITVGGRDFVFLDGGITMYNNPAFQLFLMATLSSYGLNWRSGEKDLLLVSVGSGTNPRADDLLTPGHMNLWYSAHAVPAALMGSASAEQDILCRIFGRPVAGPFIDRELGDLSTATGVLTDRLFTYARYGLPLTAESLDDLGLAEIDPATIQLMDSVAHIPELQLVGARAAARQVRAEHFAGFLDPIRGER